MSIVEAEKLNVSLEETPILHDLHFRVEPGSWVALLGPNGSGKTTLLRTLSGVLSYAGTLRLFDRPVRDWSSRERARRVAVVQQAPSLAFDFTVEELVLLGRTPHKPWLAGYNAVDRGQVHRALAEVDLDGFADRSVQSLSGGERQRAYLAQALVQDADLLLLDEPTAHLDVHYQYEFMEQLRALVSRQRTVFSVVHDLELAARYADHLLVLHEGRLAADGPPQEVLTESLLTRVFRMRASVQPHPVFRIDYRAPARQVTAD